MAQSPKATMQLKSLTGAQRAAVFLMSIGEKPTSQIFEDFSEDEIQDVSQAMATLGTVDSDIVESLIQEFVSQVSNTAGLFGSYENTERLLGKVLPGGGGGGKVSEIMQHIRGPAGRTVWEKLNNIHEKTLAQYLKNEYPQTVAIVLGKLNNAHAARVMALLPQEYLNDVIDRMLHAEPVTKEILETLEQTLRTEFMANIKNSGRSDTFERIVSIFNNLDREDEGRMLSDLSERDQESAERVRSLMFTFDDLAGLDPAGFALLTSNVDKSTLAKALKGASEATADSFYSQMTTRSYNMLMDQMEHMPPIRQSDISRAQKDILDKTKELADSGALIMPGGGEEDEIVY